MYPLNIWAIDGKLVCDKRSISMSKTTPPNNAEWHNRENEDMSTPLSERTEADWRTMRSTWLDQFELVISDRPEDGYRVWRWLGAPSTSLSSYNGRSVVWWERRRWGAPLPKIPGFWPSDK